MNFDDCQVLWQKQPLPPPPDSATAEALVRRVRAGARSFDRAILWRDLREVVAALALTLAFAGQARTHALAGAPGWSLALAWLAAALPLGVAGFILFDRLRARRLRPRAAATVLSEIDHALAELRHQHRLLMNVTWWYLLPLATSGALFVMAQPVAVQSSWPVRLMLAVFTVMLLAAVNIPLWWLNRRYARKDLGPRIEQLERERRAFSEAVSPGTLSS